MKTSRSLQGLPPDERTAKYLRDILPFYPELSHYLWPGANMFNLLREAETHRTITPAGIRIDWLARNLYVEQTLYISERITMTEDQAFGQSMIDRFANTPFVPILRNGLVEWVEEVETEGGRYNRRSTLVDAINSAAAISNLTQQEVQELRRQAIILGRALMLTECCRWNVS